MEEALSQTVSELLVCIKDYMLNFSQQLLHCTIFIPE